MLFKNILVPVDGSQYSQIAANYAFWLASDTGAKITGQHVVDPRLVDLFIEPQFAEELGFSRSVDTADKVYSALRKMGKLILQLYGEEAKGRGLSTDVYLDEGYVLDEILKRSAQHDLVVIGHRGRGHKRIPAQDIVGSVAERIAIAAKCPVLIAVDPAKVPNEFLVAFDGSEPARGALLIGNALAKATGIPLRVVTVQTDRSKASEAKLTSEQGQTVLHGTIGDDRVKSSVAVKNDDRFQIVEASSPARFLLEDSARQGSLLILGAYGYRNANDNVLGSTTTHVVRRAKSSILVYR